MEEKGDLAYQKRRNAELQAQLLASQRETKRLHRRMDEMQQTINELRTFVEQGGKTHAVSKIALPADPVQKRGLSGANSHKNLIEAPRLEHIL